MDARLLNGTSLAYIGDSVLELFIRKHLLNKNITKVNDLHKLAIKYTSGESQAKIVDYLLENELLTENEIVIYKRGRNTKSNQHRKNISDASHNKSTGLEALIGYLHLSGLNDRLNDILNYIIEIVENGELLWKKVKEEKIKE